MLLTSILFFSLNVLYPIKGRNHHLNHIHFVVCKHFQFVPVKIFSSTGQRPASYFHGVVSCASVCLSVHAFFLQKTSQKLLTGFLQNFEGMFLRWSSFKFLQIIVSQEEFWLPQSKKTLKIYSSQTTNWIALLFLQECSLDRQNSLK